MDWPPIVTPHQRIDCCQVLIESQDSPCQVDRFIIEVWVIGWYAKTR